MSEQQLKSSIFEVYKRGQGTASRITVLVAVSAIVFFGCRQLVDSISGAVSTQTAWIIGGSVFAVCVLVTLHIINVPRIVDFLIASEAELRKVSWPTKPELIRQTVVVLVAIVFFCVFIWVADYVLASLVSFIMDKTTG